MKQRRDIEENTEPRTRPNIVALLLSTACVLALLVSIDWALLGWMVVRLYVLVIALVPGILLALSCTGWGDVIMQWVWRNGAGDMCLSERTLFSFACGIGMVSGAALLLGMVGGLYQPWVIALLGGGLLAGLPLWKSVAARVGDRRADRPVTDGALPARTSTVSIVAACLLALMVTMVGLVSLTPPVIFDVTEYHLGAWTDYSWDGNSLFIPMPHNFYARFPFPIESIYFLGLAAAPYHDAAPKVFNAICVLACAALAGLMARRMGGGRNGAVLAALVALAHPVMLDVSIDAMIDAPVALLVAASVYAGLIAIGGLGYGATPIPRMLFPATFLFGSALAAKYTVAQIFLLPWVVLVLWPMLWQNWRRPKLIIAAGIISLIPCALWLGKNVYFYGNPLEPFFVRWFRPEDAAGIAREKFYVESHFPQSPLTAEYWTSLLPRLGEYQWVLLVACAGWLFRGRNGAVLRVLLFAAGGWLLWNLVRESQNRFLLPAMVLLAPVAATGALAFPTVALRRVVVTVLVLFAAMQTVRYGLTLHRSAVMDYVLEFAPSDRFNLHENGEPTPRAEFYEENLGDLGRAINKLDLVMPSPRAARQTPKLLHIYEARPYLFPVAEQQYNVVWDDSELLNIIRTAETTEEAWQLVRDAGVTHVLVNRQELLRYIQQYARQAQLRRLGVRLGEDPRLAWTSTSTPQDLYPPFYRDPDWDRLRPIVNEMLSQLDSAAVVREGGPAPAPGSLPLDITLSPVPAVN